MNKKYGINGWSFPFEAYSEETLNKIKELLITLRSEVEKEFGGVDHQNELYAGTRFYDDDNVIMRIASAVKENELPKDLSPVVKEALLDAASSDYYYNFEKEWEL